jgi:hypothetical protein
VTYMPDGQGVRTSLLGIKVSRPAATLPATTTADLFSVDGGNVQLVAIVGTVTTAASATDTTLTIEHDPDAGGLNVTLGDESTSIASAAVGSVITISGTTPTVVHGQAALGGRLAVPYVLGPGDVALTTSATNTGAVRWDLYYIPLDDDATVTAV